MIDCRELRLEIIKPTLQILELDSLWAQNQLLGTCAQESKMGTFVKQINGPALGIFQMEPATHNDIWENYLKYRPKLAEKIKAIGSPKNLTLILNPKYATAMARVQYLRVAEAPPAATDIRGMAYYYKKYYNTPLGKATIEQFMENYKRYVTA